MKREIIFTLAIASSLLAPALLKSPQAVRTEATAENFYKKMECENIKGYEQPGQDYTVTLSGSAARYDANYKGIRNFVAHYYTGEYACSPVNEETRTVYINDTAVERTVNLTGGYITSDENGKSTFTFEAPYSTKAELRVRVSSNVNKTNYSIGTLNLTTVLSASVNGNSIAIPETAIVEGRVDASADQQNIAGAAKYGLTKESQVTAEGNLDGRYMTQIFKTVSLGNVTLNKGTNTITFTTKVGSASGQYDYIELIGKEDTVTLNNTTSIECENMATDAVKIGTDENGNQYDACQYGAFHKEAYLGYEAPYKASNDGFIHMFDEGKYMEWSFYSNDFYKADLVLTGATNKGINTKNYSADDLYLATAIKLYVNDKLVSIDSSLKFDGIAAGDPSTQNRNYNASNGSSLNGRYLYLLWDSVTLNSIEIIEGINKIKIVANSGSESGHWDKIALTPTTIDTVNKKAF